MDTEFIYWRHHTLPGIKVEEICGAEDRPQPLWLEMAYQVYSENGKDGYREIGHYRTGAPFLMGENCRISVTHAGKFLAIATLPPTPEVELSEYSSRAAMGIDAERVDREQVLRVRERFLNAAEQDMIATDDVLTHIMAWTAKEAMYKAALQTGLDIRDDIRVLSLPKIGPAVTVYDKKEFDPILTGEGCVRIDGNEEHFVLYSYESEGNIVTLAYSPRCAKFGYKNTDRN
ncbi:MAG: 4'-phosphopantetheinyl transferase superfamily protein [Muribaculaceae bacterium]|nr:4'-phosphopantetheinyl transferase superfamily protein [Muribaculaceae bacterium]